MSGFLPIAFSSPWVLSALILLPAIWWLLRLVPPRPKEILFPPTRLLLDIENKEETPSQSPWWLTVLRLLMAAIVILALAGPIWRPAAGPVASASGPLWLILDNGWASAREWPERLSAAEAIIRQAENVGTPVLLAATADGTSQPLVPGTAQEARDRLRALAPRSWPAKPNDLSDALQTAFTEAAPGNIIWMTDGLGGSEVDAFAAKLASFGGDNDITLYQAPEMIVGLSDVRNLADKMIVEGNRSQATGPNSLAVRAHDAKGLVLGQATMSFNDGEAVAEASFELPVELRNEIARVEIVDELTAGAVQMVDDRWRRRSVGLLAGGSSDLAQPLLSPLYYLRKALLPFSDVREPRDADLAKAMPDLIQQNVSVIMLADIGVISEEAQEEISKWVSDGGVLVRFAGPRLASGADDLVPVSLRTGDRALGGSLTWQKPQGLGSFSDASPFKGVTIPDDVQVERQVLAEPDESLPDRTWASLTDGTPLVTAEQFGSGWIVLFHVTADTAWSNLPLSGAFVEMLRQIVAFSSVAGGATDNNEDGNQSVLAPLRLLDGFGRYTPPAPTVRPIATNAFANTPADQEHPPGLYGTEDAYQAHNLMKKGDQLIQFDPAVMGDAITLRSYQVESPVDLRAILFVLATLLLIADAVAVLVLAGGWRLPNFKRGGQVAGGLILAAVLFPVLSGGGVLAQEVDRVDTARALEATTKTRLAYVLTGNPEIDEVSKRGLIGLSTYLSDRTALEPGEPMGVDIDTDELAYFPLLYWPIDAAADAPSSRSMARVDAFMRDGGSILFDTRDQAGAQMGTSGLGTTPSTTKLREILSGLDIPALEPVPADHVLTKAFFLLEHFPGRWSGGPLWVEALPEVTEPTGRPVRAGDGVSPILITANDFAAAWAVDESNLYMFPTVPADPSQREFAYRTGVNIVMYALTGNYKADQVHVPALLERLGQ
ncbi:MAG: DUF4159 domain-containing protein [Stappiaceae bacterium]